MANNSTLMGDAEALLQILNDDFSETEGLFEDDVATSIRAYTFYAKTTLEHISFPNVITVGEQAFSNCSNLKTINMPKATTIGRSAFSFSGNNTNRMTVVLPKAAGVFSGVFNRSMIQVCDLGPDVTRLQSDTFYTNVTTKICLVLILRRTTDIVTAGSQDSINGLVDVYVPQSLKASYQAATYWSTNSGITFHDIEGSEYEDYYADGTPVE